MSWAAMLISITLYTKTDCPLCDNLKADLLTIQPEIGFNLFEVDLSEDERVFDVGEATKMLQYANLLPVLDIENGEILYSPFSYDELFDAIDRAVTRSTLVNTKDQAEPE